VAREHLDPGRVRHRAVRTVDGVEQPPAQPVAQTRHCGVAVARSAATRRKRRRQPDGTRHVLGAAPPFTFLSAAVLARLEDKRGC